MSGIINIQSNRRNSSQPCLILVLFFLCITVLAVQSLYATTKIPKVRHSLKAMDLSRPPTTEELMAAGQLGGQLYPTADITIKDTIVVGENNSLKSQSLSDQKHLNRNRAINLSFGKAIQAWNRHEYKAAVQLFKNHLENYPDSPWASESVLHMACDDRYNGRYSKAEDNLRWILEMNQGSTHFGAKMLLNKARLRLGVLKVLQNNIEKAMEQFSKLKQESPDWRHRTFASHWIQRLSRFSSNKLAMLNCGVQALAYVLKKDGREVEARNVLEIQPASFRGQSINEIKTIANNYGYELSGRRLSVFQIEEIPLPAIVHLSSSDAGDRGHYWVFEEQNDGILKFFDPQSGRRFNQQQKEFAEEWSGYVLVFSKNDLLPGKKLSESEMEQIYGGCCGNPRPESDQGDPGRNKGPEEKNDPCGAPNWSVNMANMNLYVTDTPLWYSPSIGPPIRISLNYNSQSATAYNEPFGNKWQFNYGSYLVEDTTGTVVIFMPDGRRDEYTTDAAGYVSPYQVFNKLTKIANNHFELRFPNDTIYVYKIPEATSSLQPFLVEIRDPHGQKLAISYDSNVQLTTITDATGRSTTLSYNSDGLVTQVTDPFGRSASFDYDLNRNLTKITDMGGYWSTIKYDKDIYMTSISNERGTWEFYVEPADGIIANFDNYPPPGDSMWENYRITVTNPLGGKEEYFYYGGCDDEYGCAGYSWYVSPMDYIKWESQEINTFKINTPKIRYFFTAKENAEISRIIYPEGGLITYLYDSLGNRRMSRIPPEHIIEYAYNNMGRVTKIIDSNYTVTTLNYDPKGVDLQEIINGLGTIRMTYNNIHDITSITDRLDNRTVFTYNSFGQVTSMADSLNIVNNYLYNEDHRIKQVERDGKVLTSYTYDPIGRIKTITDATGIKVTYDYNELNDPTKITFPDGKFVSFTYSICCPHLVESVTDHTGRTTRYVYNELKYRTEIINPEGGTTQFSYDKNQNLIKLTDQNRNATTYQYDLENRLIKKIYDDGKNVSYIYNKEGLLTRRTNARGISTDYTYDRNYNLVAISHSDATPGVIYNYDKYDRLTQRKDGIGTYIYSYDANSRLISIDGPWMNDTLTYYYDSIGRLTKIVSEGGKAVAYTYDSQNRLTTVQRGTNIYTYVYNNDANPIVQRLIRPNGSITTYQSDILNRLTQISNKNSSSKIIDQYAYTYNQQDLLSSETITNGSPITIQKNGLVTYNYNDLNQVLYSTNSEKTFTYDNDGNMTKGYTPEGYLFTATYDAENRLASVEYTDSGGIAHRIKYEYSGDHFLARKTEYENGTLTADMRFLRSGFLPFQERNRNNDVVREYTWGLNMGGGIGGLLSLKQGGLEYSYLYDGRGNVTSLIDGSQSVKVTYTYDAFGNLTAKIGVLEQPIQFSTKRYDEKVGLYYYGYRFYSPQIGRWLNRDPLGEVVGNNLYGFAFNNPVNYYDPMGLWTSNIVSAVFSMGLEGYRQYNCGTFHLDRLLIAGFTGFIGGFGGFGWGDSGPYVALLAGAASNMLNTVLQQEIDPSRDTFDTLDILKSGMSGAIGGYIAGGIGHAAFISLENKIARSVFNKYWHSGYGTLKFHKYVVEKYIVKQLSRKYSAIGEAGGSVVGGIIVNLF